MPESFVEVFLNSVRFGDVIISLGFQGPATLWVIFPNIEPKSPFMTFPQVLSLITWVKRSVRSSFRDRHQALGKLRPEELHLPSGVSGWMSLSQLMQWLQQLPGNEFWGMTRPTLSTAHCWVWGWGCLSVPFCTSYWTCPLPVSSAQMSQPGAWFLGCMYLILPLCQWNGLCGEEHFLIPY